MPYSWVCPTILHIGNASGWELHLPHQPTLIQLPFFSVSFSYLWAINAALSNVPVVVQAKRAMEGHAYHLLKNKLHGESGALVL